MADGEIPHLDFMTPIGILGFAPLTLFLKLGSAAGQAAVLANLLVCVILLPATWWVGVSRLGPRMAYIFGVTIIVLTTAMVYGAGSVSLGFSMFYNRWAWAVTFIILVTLLFQPKTTRASRWVDPLIIGLGMAMLALTKMSFFVPLAPAVIVILLAQKQNKLAAQSIITGALAAIIVALWLGIDFIFAYADDLLAVASGGAGRDFPGLDIAGVLADPTMLSATFVLLASAIFFRKTGRMHQGLVMLILTPVFVYITFQNWGNDPKWLFFVVLYLVANLPDINRGPFMGMPARQVGIVLATIAATAAVPSFASLLSSTPRSAFASFEKAAKIPLADNLADMWMPQNRILVSNQTIEFIDETEPEDTPRLMINGVELPQCQVEGGYIAYVNAMAKALDTQGGFANKQVLIADVLNIVWMMGDTLRVEGGSVWYYNDTSGFDAAEYFLVPRCALRPNSRESMVEQMLETGWVLEPAYASELLDLYKIVRTP
ncbi:MAG: hypothetical protein L3J33_09770 [Rhodobacteraceae bacterium]|nr:hypothetical protein [Paracoccaceae bacterium]